MVVLLMNDSRYGVIKNIQDDIYGGRHCLRGAAHARLCTVLCQLEGHPPAPRTIPSTSGPQCWPRPWPARRPGGGGGGHGRPGGRLPSSLPAPFCKQRLSPCPAQATTVNISKSPGAVALAPSASAIYQRMAAQPRGAHQPRCGPGPPGSRTLQAELEALGVCKWSANVPEDCSLLLGMRRPRRAGRPCACPRLARGTECAVLSVGALAEAWLARATWLTRPSSGGTQVHLLAGAIGGIDALAAARLRRLEPR